MFSQFDARVDLTRFEKSVRKYEETEIREGQILFWGSSLFTRWSEAYDNIPLEEVILGKDGSTVAVNHGIGGATAEELLFYYPRMVQPWKPRALLIYAFPNDSAAGYSPFEVMALKAKLLDHARAHMPGIRFYLLGVNLRTKYLDEGGLWDTTENRMLQHNELLEDYCRRHDDCTYLAIHKSPLFFARPEDAGDYKKTRRDIFVEDGIHFNREGYALFTQFIRDSLDDIL